MIGFTASTPGWEEMTNEAAYRWTRHTGMRAEIIHVRNAEEAHRFKLSLPQAAWYFDADLWFVRDITLPLVRDDTIIATPTYLDERGQRFIDRYSAEAGIDRRCWFSSALFGADWLNGAAARSLALAREFARENAISDRDEHPLNVGAQRAGAVIGMLPSHFNWCVGHYGYAPAGGAFAIHAAGLPASEKLSALRSRCHDPH